MSSPTSKNEGRVGRVQTKVKGRESRSEERGSKSKECKVYMYNVRFFFQRQKAKSARGELCAGNKRKPKNKSKGKGRKYIEIEIEVYISLKARGKAGGKESMCACCLIHCSVFGFLVVGVFQSKPKGDGREAEKEGGEKRRQQQGDYVQYATTKKPTRPRNVRK